jgi:3',5'-cyclic AMP phosphodiesterase CpdA
MQSRIIHISDTHFGNPKAIRPRGEIQKFLSVFLRSALDPDRTALVI